jgi:membrane associated rhomboid family serine protease
VSAAQNTPIFNAPDAVKWIAGATLLAHIGRVYLLSDEDALSLLVDMAFIPARYSEASLAAHGLGWPLFSTPVTYLLVHGDFTHLLVNVLMFLAFGAAVGRRMGSWAMPQFYVRIDSARYRRVGRCCWNGWRCVPHEFSGLRSFQSHAFQ